MTCKHLGGCGLLFQGLPRLGHQPRVLHRNDRLRGEVLQPRNLLVGKSPNFTAVNDNYPEYRVPLCVTERTASSADPARSTCSRNSGTSWNETSPSRANKIIELDILLAQNHTLWRRAFHNCTLGCCHSHSSKAGIPVRRGKLERRFAVTDPQMRRGRSATGNTVPSRESRRIPGRGRRARN